MHFAFQPEEWTMAKATPEQTSMSNNAALNKMVKEHMVAAFAAGMVPVPIGGMVVISAVQLHLLKRVAEKFDIPFSKNAIRAILGALIGGVVPAMSGPLLTSLVKEIPVAGMVLGVVTMPVLSATTTYAVGHIFIEHFESGGTLLSLDIETAKARFAQLFKKGVEAAENMAHAAETNTDQPEEDEK